MRWWSRQTTLLTKIIRRLSYSKTGITSYTKAASSTRERLIASTHSTSRSIKKMCRRVKHVQKQRYQRSTMRQVKIQIKAAQMLVLPHQPTHQSTTKWRNQTLSGREMKRCCYSTSSSTWLTKETSSWKTSRKPIGRQFAILCLAAHPSSARNGGFSSRTSRGKSLLGQTKRLRFLG